MQKQSQDLCCELGLALCLIQYSTQVQNSTSPLESVAMYGIHVTLETWNLKPCVWSGKSQLPCSQRLRLHGLTSSDLGHGTWDPCEPAPSLFGRCSCIPHELNKLRNFGSAPQLFFFSLLDVSAALKLCTRRMSQRTCSKTNPNTSKLDPHAGRNLWRISVN